MTRNHWTLIAALFLLFAFHPAQATTGEWCGYDSKATIPVGNNKDMANRQYAIDAAIKRCPGLTNLLNQMKEWSTACYKARQKNPASTDSTMCKQGYSCLALQVQVTNANPAPCFTIGTHPDVASCFSDLNSTYSTTTHSCISSTTPPPSTEPPASEPTPAPEPIPAPVDSTQTQCMSTYSNGGTQDATLTSLKGSIVNINRDINYCTRSRSCTPSTAAKYQSEVDARNICCTALNGSVQCPQ